MPKKTDKQKTLVLLDSHAILHRAYHALPDFSSPSGEPTGALYGVVSMLIRIIEDLKPDYLIACYDLPEPTYRHEAFEGYKAKRAKTDEALVQQIERSRDIFQVFGIPIYEHPGFEADDMLGTIVAECKGEKDLNIIIASGDMDTLQLVDKKKVQVYTQRKGSEVVLFDEVAVKEKFGFGPLLTIDFKGLRGDASDNIPGVPGVGEGSASKLIQTYGGLEKIYKALKKDGAEKVAKKAGIQKRFAELVLNHEEEAEFSKMLATIRPDAPIDFKVPEKNWREAVDTEKSLSLFNELGFRTLTARFKVLMDISEEELALELDESIDKREVQEAAVLLWLLESDRTQVGYEDVIDYGRSSFNTVDFKKIKSELEKAVKENKLWTIYEEIEKPLMPVLEKVNENGITLDVAYLKKLSKKFHTELEKLEKSIYELAEQEFNINSPKQLGEILYDKLELKPKNQKKTSTGQRSTRESELVKMKDDHPIIEDLLRYRELQKLVSTYVDNLPKLVSKDGRLRTHFLQTGTTTGRVSSKDPNLQNIPIRTEEGRDVRGAFVAAPGYSLVALDYSQIELRIAAILAGDKSLIDIFKRGEDVHRGVAIRVFGVNAEEVTAEMRRQAKVINFGILYGMGVNALRTNLGDDTPREEAQQFLNAYFHTFSRLAEYLEETKAFAREHGYTETMFGRRRYFPGINSGAPFIRASAERMAINAPIQGTEGDILRIAMIEAQEYIEKNKFAKDVRTLLQVHDELVFEVKESRLKEVVPKLVDIMQGVFGEKDSKEVPIIVEAKTGPNWRDLSPWEK